MTYPDWLRELANAVAAVADSAHLCLVFSDYLRTDPTDDRFAEHAPERAVLAAMSALPPHPAFVTRLLAEITMVETLADTPFLNAVGWGREMIRDPNQARATWLRKRADQLEAL